MPCPADCHLNQSNRHSRLFIIYSKKNLDLPTTSKLILHSCPISSKTEIVCRLVPELPLFVGDMMWQTMNILVKQRWKPDTDLHKSLAFLALDCFKLPPVQCHHLINVMGCIRDHVGKRKISRYLEYVQRHLKLGFRDQVSTFWKTQR